MARPLRLEFPGALYHVTARGNRRKWIFLNDSDRLCWLGLLASVCKRCHFVVHAFCQMGNHYHLVLETAEGNLGNGMRQFNSAYSQQFNRRHRLVGHLYQGRYKAILVQHESYLLQLVRYVVLNPVRAGIVEDPGDWPWGSYRMMTDDAVAPEWLDAKGVLGHFGQSRQQAVKAFRDFVRAGVGMPSPLEDMRHRLVLGDQAFIDLASERMALGNFTGVVRTQRRITALTLGQYQDRFNDRDKAMAAAYCSTLYSMVEIGKYFGVSDKTVARAVNRYA